MRVAVFRAADDGRRTAAKVKGLGHAPVMAPVMRIVPTGLPFATDGVGGLIFTSAHAPESLAGHRQGVSLHGIPCWCVGSRTAEAARLAGFKHVIAGPGDAATLADAIAASAPPSPLIFVTGRDRKHNLEQDLAQAGIALRVVVAYAAEVVSEWPQAMVARLAASDAALHYSRRSAELAHRLTRSAGLQAEFGKWRHFCLSDDVAAALAHVMPDRVSVAPWPEEASLLALLGPATERRTPA